MTPTLIVLVLLVIAVGVVVVAVRRKPEAPRPASREGDTAWNDPVTPGQPAKAPEDLRPEDRPRA